MAAPAPKSNTQLDPGRLRGQLRETIEGFTFPSVPERRGDKKSPENLDPRDRDG